MIRDRKERGTPAGSLALGAGWSGGTRLALCGLFIAFTGNWDTARPTEGAYSVAFTAKLSDGTALPNTAAASGLGQELAQVELLINVLIDARVDAITGLKRVVPGETAPAAIAPKASPPSSIVEGAVVDLSFAASPSAMRKVLNQIASSEQAFFIVRSLRVQNEQQKGPSRETSASAKNTTGSLPPATAGSAGAIKFIVGNEHVETAAKIELVKFAF